MSIRKGCVSVAILNILHRKHNKKRHVNENLKKRQAAFEQEILKLSPHSFVIRDACAG